MRTSDAALAEVAKVKETAGKLADGDYPEDADHVRVLAGMIHQLAEQVERLADPGIGQREGEAPMVEHVDREAFLEEDRSPEQGPAAPLANRAE